MSSVPPSSATETVTVTSADAGATIFLVPQQHLVVETGFPGPPAWTGTPSAGDLFWTPPEASYPGTLYRNGSRTCPGGNAIAVFTAVGTGGTSVIAQTSGGSESEAFIQIYVVVRGQ